MNVLLIYPPYGNITGVYASLPNLTGFLRARGIATTQWDLNIELLGEILKPSRVDSFVDSAEKRFAELDARSELTEEEGGQYHALAHTLPYAARFRHLPDPMGNLRAERGADGSTPGPWNAGTMRLLARYYALISAVYYPERIDYRSPNTPRHTPVHPSGTVADALKNIPCRGLVDEVAAGMLEKKIEDVSPDLVGFSVTYRDQFIPALKLAHHVKQQWPKCHVVAGGGFFSTVTREVEDREFFDYFDSLILDDGEWPLFHLVQAIANAGTEGSRPEFETVPNLLYRNEQGTVVKTDAVLYGQLEEYPAPDFEGIPFDLYCRSRRHQELPLILAHGCYWNKCTFCHQLPYVTYYRPQQIDIVLDKIRTMVRQTGIDNIHFVDEACPPKLLRQFCERLLRDRLGIRWWGNIRFEKYYSQEFCRTMRQAGCWKVSAGLEAANERVLELIDKGISFETMKQVMRNFSSAGIRVHTYLIVGFPGETRAEAEESAQRVYELIRGKTIHSVNWHSFGLEVHSIVGENFDRFGILSASAPTALESSFSDVRMAEGIPPAEAAALRDEYQENARRLFSQVHSAFLSGAEESSELDQAKLLRQRFLPPDDLVVREHCFSLRRPTATDGRQSPPERRNVVFMMNLSSGRSAEVPDLVRRLLSLLDGRRSVRDALVELEVGEDRWAEVCLPLHDALNAFRYISL